MLIQKDEATAARRRIPVYLVDVTDGITPEPGEAGGQPEIIKNDGTKENTGGVLVDDDATNGSYYVELSLGNVDIEASAKVTYKSAATAQFNWPIQIVNFDPYAANLPADVKAIGGVAGDAALLSRFLNSFMMNSTTIASVSSQTQFALTAGSSDDDSYEKCIIVFTDVASESLKGHAIIKTYTASGSLVVLEAAPEFTIAATDKIEIFALSTLLPAKALVDIGATEARFAQLDEDNMPGDIDDILTDTSTTIPGTLTTIDTVVDSILVDTGTTLDNHLTDIKGTAFVKDTHSLIDIETYVDLIDDGTSGLAKIATDAAAILVDTATTIPGTLTTIDAVVDSILVDTAEIGVAGIGLSNIPWNSSWDLEVESEVNDALVVLHLDHLLAVDTGGTLPGVSGALWQDLLEDDGGTWRFIANALETAPSIILGPLVSATNAGNRVTSPIALETHQDSGKTFVLTVLDANDVAVDLSSKTLQLSVTDRNRPDPNLIFKVNEPAITKSGSPTQNIATIPTLAADVGDASEDLLWQLWDTDGEGEVLLWGDFKIKMAKKA